MAPTTTWLAQHAWLGGDRLESDVLIRVEDGSITEIRPVADRSEGVRLAGIALPGLVNGHSHAFHRLLRGRTHRQGGDFWSWRDLMYEVAASLTPESYEERATAVYIEMALAGITTVGEFHYLHHQPNGEPYADPNEMGHALIRAARRAGLRIALLDAGYLASGLGSDALSPVQRRFSDETGNRWLARVDQLAASYAGADDVRIGLAPHSVRAVPERDLVSVAEHRWANAPIHIHVSEQTAENEACLQATGLTPVGLLERIGLLGPDTTAIHATHLTLEDVNSLGSSGTGVCYCATTERDLADGIGPSGDLKRAGSPLSVGSDSHAVIDLFEEARGIELHERLRTNRRGVFAASELAEALTVNGARALGFPVGRLERGSPADFIMIAGDTVRTAGSGAELSGVVYTAGAGDVTDVFVAGRRVVAGGHHPGWESSKASLQTKDGT